MVRPEAGSAPTTPGDGMPVAPGPGTAALPVSGPRPSGPPQPLAPGEQVAIPPGPGVRPPFVAPPTDGARRRRWLAVGLAGAAALLCCVGGLFGLGALVVLGNQAIEDQAHRTVTEYLTAVQQREYAEAYALLCEGERGRVSLARFARSFADEPDIVSFEVGELVAGDGLVVPATIRHDGGAVDEVRFVLEQEQSTGELKVCGQEG